MSIKNVCMIMAGIALMLIQAGCGSGGGSTTASVTTPSGTVTVSSKSVLGAVSTAVKGIEMTLVLPSGVTVAADSSGITNAGVVTLLSPNNVTSSNGAVLAKYTPASGSTPGKVKIVIIRGDTPFVPGDFLNVKCDVVAGISVTSEMFSYEGLKAYDANGAAITTPVTSEILL